MRVMKAEAGKKMENKVKHHEIEELQEKLSLNKALRDITNRIHSASHIKQILVDLKDGILNLFNAYSITIYVADQKKNEIYSMFLAGSHLKEIRLPIDSESVAGYVANTGKAVNIIDAYNRKELRKIDEKLTFDSSWDKKIGYKTAQILAVPISRKDRLMGVIQIINKKGGGKFSAEEQSFLEEIADVLGIAFHNQQRTKKRRGRFDYL
ncbi:unnamed protein product, partial [marine sediment metagenome]